MNINIKDKNYYSIIEIKKRLGLNFPKRILAIEINPNNVTFEIQSSLDGKNWTEMSQQWLTELHSKKV